MSATEPVPVEEIKPPRRISVHVLKTIQPYFDDVVAGRKTFEFRRDDRAPYFQAGDLVVLTEWSNEKGASGARFIKRIGYVLRGSPTMPNSYCAFALEPATAREIDMAEIATSGVAVSK